MARGGSLVGKITGAAGFVLICLGFAGAGMSRQDTMDDFFTVCTSHWATATPEDCVCALDEMKSRVGLWRYWGIPTGSYGLQPFISVGRLQNDVLIAGAACGLTLKTGKRKGA